MERKDLLGINGGTFKPQGRAIADNAASDVRVLVVGNPCNTNCLIARSNAPEVPGGALVRHDAPRPEPGPEPARAGGPGCSNGAVTNLAVYGNHSSTQFPDFENALIGGRPAVEVIGDRAWLEGEFSTTVKKRGAAVIEARGLSSAASAASAVIDSVSSIVRPTPPGGWVSVAVVSHGEYGVAEGLQFGFPVRSDGTGWEVVADQPHGEFASGRSRRRQTSWRASGRRWPGSSASRAPGRGSAARRCPLPCRGASGCGRPTKARPGPRWPRAGRSVNTPPMSDLERGPMRPDGSLAGDGVDRLQAQQGHAEVCPRNHQHREGVDEPDAEVQEEVAVAAFEARERGHGVGREPDDDGVGDRPEGAGPPRRERDVLPGCRETRRSHAGPVLPSARARKATVT